MLKDLLGSGAWTFNMHAGDLRKHQEILPAKKKVNPRRGHLGPPAPLLQVSRVSEGQRQVSAGVRSEA
jgi:hypothetical protein